MNHAGTNEGQHDGGLEASGEVEPTGVDSNSDASQVNGSEASSGQESELDHIVEDASTEGLVVAEDGALAVEDIDERTYLDDFETDENAENHGIWAEDISTGISFLICHNDSPAFSADLLKRARKFMRVLQAAQGKNAKPATIKRARELNDRLWCESASRYLVKGWKGLYDRDTGEELPFSQEACLKLLRKRKFRSIIENLTKDDSIFEPTREQLGEG